MWAIITVITSFLISILSIRFTLKKNWGDQWLINVIITGSVHKSRNYYFHYYYYYYYY